MLPIISRAFWPSHTFVGKRYLPAEDFASLCVAIGLHQCTSLELEGYEREGLMNPVARLIMPDDYAQAVHSAFLTQAATLQIAEEHAALHDLRSEIVNYGSMFRAGRGGNDLRHPIDKAWGQTPAVVKPSEQTFRLWDDFRVDYSVGDRQFSAPTTTHYYHAWQAFELYQVRRFDKGLYQDKCPYISRPLGVDDGLVKSLWPFFNAVSLYRHARDLKRQVIWWRRFQQAPDVSEEFFTLDAAEQADFEQTVRESSQAALDETGLSEDVAIRYLRGELHLYHQLELAERARLAQTCQHELADALECLSLAFGVSSNEISQRVGGIAGYNVDYLELLFPNRRIQARAKAKRIILNLAQEHNAKARNFAMTEADIDALLDYLERGELALFATILYQLNEAYFRDSSIQAAEQFLWLKSLAAFPESLTRVFVWRRDILKALRKRKRYPGMGDIYQAFLQAEAKDVECSYSNLPKNSHSANTAVQFTKNRQRALARIGRSRSESYYLATNLSLAILLRNFTSHHLVDNPELIRPGYTTCVRAVLSAAFLTWKLAQKKRWTS